MNQENSSVVINSSGNKQRDSNMELLRIIAMALVLVVHCGNRFIGEPSSIEASTNIIPTIVRVLFQNLSIICVDVFVLISGWFGINSSVKSFSKYIFQCLYFGVVVYFLACILGIDNLSIKGLCSTVQLTRGYWFVKTYLCLMIFAPVLNSFVDTMSKTMVKMFLVLFFLFQTVFAWVYPFVPWINDGYSIASFIGLYILARYVRLYGARFDKISITKLLVLFLSSVCLNAIADYFMLIRSIHFTSSVISYINPLVILESLLLLLIFSRLKIKSRKINWIASSSFAVYLLHAHPSIFENVFGKNVNYVYSTYNGGGCILMLFCFLIVVFTLAIILDQPRKLAWNSFSNKIKVLR